MPLKYPITFIEQPSEQEYSALTKGINEFAASRGHRCTSSYFFAAYNEKNEIVAAISGYDNFGGAEIGGLWVHESLRGKGYGKALVEKAQEWARNKSCPFMTVFTIKEWPAFEWYKKLGFEVEFERPGHGNNTTGCYLIKVL